MPIVVCAPTARTPPKLERFVREYDIKIAIHNHGRTGKHFPTPQSVLKFVNNMDPRCSLCVDVGHTAETGGGRCRFHPRSGIEIGRFITREELLIKS